MAARIRAITFDCTDAQSLASFYAELLQLHHRSVDSPGWVIIKAADGRRPGMSFAGADGQPARWPDPERPQQAHLDLATDDLRTTEALVLRLGATRLTPPESGNLVFADPEGHPFCLLSAPEIP